jgi:hypothetical protein
VPMDAGRLLTREVQHVPTDMPRPTPSGNVSARSPPPRPFPPG